MWGPNSHAHLDDLYVQYWIVCHGNVVRICPGTTTITDQDGLVTPEYLLRLLPLRQIKLASINPRLLVAPIHTRATVGNDIVAGVFTITVGFLRLEGTELVKSVLDSCIIAECYITHTRSLIVEDSGSPGGLPDNAYSSLTQDIAQVCICSRIISFHFLLTLNAFRRSKK